MAIKFSQFNERTESTATMSLVGYDGEQNIRILADDLLANPYINGTENTLAMFGTGGTIVVDSIVSQDAGATLLTVAGQLNVDAAATFDTSITVTGDSTLNGNITLGDTSADLITQTGTLYLNGPIKDTTDTLGATDQILVSDASGELTFTDLADISTGAAEVVEVPVKNLQGSPLTKGDPVFISGSVGTSGRLEVQLADASNAAKMPALGLLKQDLAINEEGFVVVTGKLRNLTTDPIDGATPSPNAVIYVKGGGTTGNALTLTKPTGANLIQNMGKVGRVSTANDGTFVVSSILRTNDIPNLTQGKIWVGSTGNTIESSSITFTEATGAVQLNEYGVGSITGTAAYNLSVDASGNIIETTAVPGNVVETLTAASGTYISLTDATSATGDVDLGTFDLSAIDGSSDTTTRFLSKDNTWDIPSYTTVTTTDGTYINLTPNSATSGAVTVTADLSAVDGVAAVGERYLTKNNTWAEVATIPGTYTFNVSDGTASTTINSGDTLGILGGTYITTSNTTGNVTVSHDATSRTDTTSTSTPGYGGTFTVVDSISTNATGHLEAINVKTVTMPPADDTNTTYDLSGFGSTNGTAGVQLIGSDGSIDPVTITGAGTTTVVHSSGTLTITSNDQYTGTVTSVSGGTYITDTGTATDPVLNHDATSRTDTTSSDSPGVSGSFTAVDSVTTNATGHVTAINVKTVTLPDDGVDGSGTLNYVAKWTPDGDTLGDSIIYDDGTNVGVGIASPQTILHVGADGTATATQELRVEGTTASGYGGGARINLLSSQYGTTGIYFGDQATAGSQPGKIEWIDISNALYYTSQIYHDWFAGTPAARMRFNSSGQLTVNTVTAAGQFTVEGAAATSQYLVVGKTVGINNWSGLYHHSSNNRITLDLRDGSGTQTVTINSNGDSYLNGGNVGIGTSTPDRTFTVEAASNPVLIGTPTGKRMQWENPNYITGYAEDPTSAGTYRKTFDFDGDWIGGGYVGVYESRTGQPGASMHAASYVNASGHSANQIKVYKPLTGSSSILLESGDRGSDATRYSGIQINDSRTPVGYPASRFRLGADLTTEPTIPFYVNGDSKINGDLTVTGAYYDSSSSAGTSGQVLSSTGTGTSWVAAGGSYTPSAISTNTNAVNNYLYILTANLTLTLPASPSAGDSIKIANFSGVTTCVIARNGNNIMASATDLTLDNDKANFELVYTDATRGWVIIGATGELN